MSGAGVMTVFRRVLVFACAVFILSSVCFAAVGNWKSFTDMKNVRSVVADSSSFWAATSGGVFRFRPADSTYQKFTNSEGLTSNDVTAIFVDRDQNIWIGEQSGAVDMYIPSTDSWKYITDILVTDKSAKTINDFYQQGDTLYIATSFGVSVFSLSKFEFIDTYSNFVSSLQPNVNTVCVFNGHIIVGSSTGIMISKTGATNLAAPESWTASSTQIANSFVVLNGELFAGSNDGVLKYVSGGWIRVSSAGIRSIVFGSSSQSVIFGEVLTGGTGELKSIDLSSTVSSLASFPDSVLCGCLSPTGISCVGLLSSGIGLFNAAASSFTAYAPNGPFSNLFYQLAVDNNGALWAASARSGGKGFYSYNGTQWTNYNRGTSALVPNNECFAIAVGPDNSKWVSTWGGGIVLVNNEGVIVKVFNHATAGFIGLPTDVNYIVPAKVAFDNEGNAWTSVYWSADFNRVVWEMTADSVWHPFKGSPYGSYSEFMLGTEIDQYNTKWFVNTLTGFTRSATIVFFNEEVNVSGTADGWGTITESDGATNSFVQSIAVDKTGDVWLGTGTGVTIITTPSKPAQRVSQVYLGSIRDLSINCVAVDPIDNKWLGTQSGVFVLSPGGDQLLTQYNVSNTNGKLVDNNVLSIAFDKEKGVAYFGTEKGLSSLEIPAVAPKASLSVIDLSPNPVYLPQQSSVEIGGLVDESTIKVLSISGKVVKEFTAQGGGRAFWDCKDSDGKTVATGIYVIVAHDRTGTQVASAKVAVIHK